jgi:hypothetical protein
MSKSKSQNNSTTPTVVSRVQHAIAIQNGGQVPKGSYVGRLQRTVAKAQLVTVEKSK